VLNRSVARLTLFEKHGDYEAFEQVISEMLDFDMNKISVQAQL